MEITCLAAGFDGTHVMTGTWLDTIKALRGPDRQNLVDAYVFLERYCNDGSISGFDRTVPERYSPFTKKATFELPILELDRYRLIQIGEIPYLWARDTLLAGKLPMPIHPVSENDLISSHPALGGVSQFTIPVIPTSSGRTVMHTSGRETPHFIKLHYPYEIGRFGRELKLHKWLSGLENSRELRQHEVEFPRGLAYLDEHSGVYYEGEHPIGGFGAIFRDFRPRPPRNNSPLLVPTFSLYAERGRPSGYRPLLVDLLEVLTKGRARLDDFLQVLIRPVLECYRFLTLDLGLIPEAHSQNTLLECDLESCVVRVVFRDLGDIFKDYSIRCARRLHTSFCSYKCLDPRQDADIFQRRSFAFDFKLGYYLLEPMCRCFADATGVAVNNVIPAVRELSVSLWKDADDYFEDSAHWYCYPPERGVNRDSYERRSKPLFR